MEGFPSELRQHDPPRSPGRKASLAIALACGGVPESCKKTKNKKPRQSGSPRCHHALSIGLFDHNYLNKKNALYLCGWNCRRKADVYAASV